MAENLVVSRYFSDSYKLVSGSSPTADINKFKDVDSYPGNKKKIQTKELGFSREEVEQSEKNWQKINTIMNLRIQCFEKAPELKEDELFYGFSFQEINCSKIYHRKNLRSCFLAITKIYKLIKSTNIAPKRLAKKKVNKLTHTKTKSKKTQTKNGNQNSDSKSIKNKELLSNYQSIYFRTEHFFNNLKLSNITDSSKLTKASTRVKNTNNNSDFFNLYENLEATKPTMCDNRNMDFNKKKTRKEAIPNISVASNNYNIKNCDVRIGSEIKGNTKDSLNAYFKKDKVNNNLAEIHKHKINTPEEEKRTNEVSSHLKIKTSCYKDTEATLNKLRTETKDIKLERELDIQNYKQTKEDGKLNAVIEDIQIIKLETETINHSIDFETKYFELLASNKRNTVEKEVNTGIPLWIPPRSPHNLIEEVLYHDPWALLIATIFLNRTSCMVARPYVFRFLVENPDPYKVLDMYPQDLEKYFVNLGLVRTRAVQIWRMSNEYLHKNWKNPSDLYGIGEYGDSAYKIFCLGDFSVQPKDRFLKIYKAWYEKIVKDGVG